MWLEQLGAYCKVGNSLQNADKGNAIPKSDWLLTMARIPMRLRLDVRRVIMRFRHSEML